MRISPPKKFLNVRITKFFACLTIISLLLMLLLAACGTNTITPLAQPPTVTPTSYTPLASKTTPTIQLTATVNNNIIIVKKETAIAEATLTKIAEPTPTPTPTLASGTPFCRASDLVITDGLQGATGSLVGGITFTNKSSTDCYLQGYPQVQIQDNNKQPLNLDYGPICLPCTNPNATNQQQQATITALGQPKIVLLPNKSASVMIIWDNWCNSMPKGLQFVVTLPNDTEKLTIPIYGVEQTPLDITPRCDAPDAPSGLNIGAFQYTRG